MTAIKSDVVRVNYTVPHESIMKNQPSDVAVGKDGKLKLFDSASKYANCCLTLCS